MERIVERKQMDGNEKEDGWKIFGEATHARIKSPPPPPHTHTHEGWPVPGPAFFSFQQIVE